MYPCAFSARLCEGIAAQKKLDMLGLEARPVVSVDEMANIAGQGKGGEIPSDALHDGRREEFVAFDDLSCEELDPRLRRQEYFKNIVVYDNVDVSEASAQTGKDPILARLVDTRKGDSNKPNYWRRLVAKEFRTTVNPDLYEATPPSE